MLAFLSHDEALQARLTHDSDFFISLAAELLKRSSHEITREQRQHAKQVKLRFSVRITRFVCEVCYGILYGMSTETFARETRMSTEEAQHFVQHFYQTFPTMKQYLDDVKQRVLETGCVQSIHGRPLCFDLTRMTSSETSTARVSEMEKHNR